MDRVLKALFQIREFKLRKDDDFVDRLNNRHTTTILVMLSVVVSIKQYVGKSQQCNCNFTELLCLYTKH